VIVVGVCKLCLLERELRKSHYMPAALYPKKQKMDYATRVSKGSLVNEIKDYLLCGECEGRFDQNGEDEVLKHIRPKVGKSFPLHEKLRVALPRAIHGDVSRFAGYELDMDMDKFAYFAISIVWRGAVHDWTMPDGSVKPKAQLGGFEEPIRLYLMKQTTLPPDTVVLVIVASDEGSRKLWFTPIIEVEDDCLNFKFMVRGVFFRVMMGYRMPRGFRDICCTSSRKCLWYGDGSHRVAEMMAIFEKE
jgi:hypothetical protein